VRKLSKLYEHVPPESVGNQQLISVSDQAGRSNVLVMAARTGFGLKLDASDPAVAELVAEVNRWRIRVLLSTQPRHPFI